MRLCGQRRYRGGAPATHPPTHAPTRRRRTARSGGRQWGTLGWCRLADARLSFSGALHTRTAARTHRRTAAPPPHEPAACRAARRPPPRRHTHATPHTAAPVTRVPPRVRRTVRLRRAATPPHSRVLPCPPARGANVHARRRPRAHAAHCGTAMRPVGHRRRRGRAEAPAHAARTHAVATAAVGCVLGSYTLHGSGTRSNRWQRRVRASVGTAGASKAHLCRHADHGSARTRARHVLAHAHTHTCTRTHTRTLACMLARVHPQADGPRAPAPNAQALTCPRSHIRTHTERTPPATPGLPPRATPAYHAPLACPRAAHFAPPRPHRD